MEIVVLFCVSFKQNHEQGRHRRVRGLFFFISKANTRLIPLAQNRISARLHSIAATYPPSVPR